MEDELPHPADAPRPRPLWPVMTVLGVVGVVVVALAITLVVVRMHDDRPRAAAGEIFSSRFLEDPLPHRGEVLLPWARTEVGASDPVDELPDLLGSPATVRAPDGGSFVRVEVDLADDYSLPFAAVAAPYTGRADVVLRADGRDYPLTGRGGLDLGPTGARGDYGGRWVAVDGKPTEIEVRVTVDGVTQVVDAADGSVDAGRAADLTTVPTADTVTAAPTTSCGEPRRLDATRLTVRYRPDLDCQVKLALRTPYVDGLGWARPGHDFLVVQLVRPRTLDLASGHGRATEYWNSRLEFSAHVGEAASLAPPTDVNSLSQSGLSIQDPDDPVQVIFDVASDQPTGDLRLDVVARACLGEPFVTQRRQVRFEWTVAGGELA